MSWQGLHFYAMMREESVQIFGFAYIYNRTLAVLHQVHAGLVVSSAAVSASGCLGIVSSVVMPEDYTDFFKPASVRRKAVFHNTPYP